MMKTASPVIILGVLMCLCLLQYSCKSTQKASVSVPVYDNPYRIPTTTPVSKSPSAIYEPPPPKTPLPPKPMPTSEQAIGTIAKDHHPSPTKTSVTASPPVVAAKEKMGLVSPPLPYPPLKQKTRRKPPTMSSSFAGTNEVLPTDIGELINKYKRAEIYFKVQVAAFSQKRSARDTYFEPLSNPDIQIDQAPSGVYRYTIGFFKTYEAASAQEQEIKKMGYTDAFVTAYDNRNNRINKEMTRILKEYEHGY